METPKISTASTSLSEEFISIGDLPSRIEVAKIKNALVAEIAARCEEKYKDDPITDLISMVSALSSNNLACAEEAFKESKYVDADRHIKNVTKVALAAADYEAQLDLQKNGS